VWEVGGRRICGMMCVPDVVWWLTVLIALKILNGLYSGCQDEEPGFNILAIDSLH
jgi:hypothetical protein